MADYIRLKMRGKDVNTICRLCLGENAIMLHVFESEGIPGWSANIAIHELLQIEVTKGDGFPQVICNECMQKLVDFKLFKQQCKINKDSLDLEYSRNREVVANEKVVGMVSCRNENQSEVRFKEEVLEVLVAADPLDLNGLENSVEAGIEGNTIEVSSAEVIGSADDQAANSPCENMSCSDHGEKEGVVHIKAESCSDGYFEEGISRESEAELTPGVNFNAGFSKEETGCSYTSVNTSDAHSYWPQNDDRGAIEVARLSNKLMAQLVKQSGDRPFEYERSSKASSRGDGLEEHVTTCSGQKSFMCSKSRKNKKPIEECNQGRSKVFPRKRKPTERTKIRSGDGRHSCDQCSKSFSQKCHLSRHTRIHSGESPYGCYHCGKTFTQKGSLKLHMRIHSGERPYVCDQCGKTFCQKIHLNVHTRSHSGERPYSCDQCSKSFSLKVHLKEHSRIHSGERPYGCDQCSKSFSQKGYLNLHMRIHSGERPYGCDQCGKTFSLKTNLNAHVKIHSGHRPFVCSQCSRAFNLKKNLVRHLKLHSQS